MKKLIPLLIAACMISGCGLKLIGPTAECIVSSEQLTVTEYCNKVSMSGDESYICELSDPCKVYRVLEIAAKEGLILDGYSADQFKSFAETVKSRVNAGITVAILKDIVMSEVTKINKIAGMQLMLLGDMFIEVPQDKVIPEADAILIISSIDDLVQEVSNLGIWID